MKQAFIKKNFRLNSLLLIRKCDEILADYNTQGYDMTLRQLYYQLVRRNEIENKKESYDNLGSLMNDARLAGYIDWAHMVDRTRNLKGIGTYTSPEERLRLLPYGYAIDKWEDQDTHIEVWVEKEALEGVFGRAANKWRIDYFACKGYTSASEMYSAGQRLTKYRQKGKRVVILHHGDHDPSGIDMTRDIQDRLELFCGVGQIEVRRMALNMPQILQYDPPANYAKNTDARYKKYREEFGEDSWELDALDPATLNKLVEDTVVEYVDTDKWKAKTEREDDEVNSLKSIGRRYLPITTFLREEYPQDFEKECEGCGIAIDEGRYCDDCEPDSDEDE